MEQHILWLYFLAIAAGTVGLVYGADRFVSGASSLAQNLNVSPLIIGLTIVSMGTSCPELLVTVTASWTGHPDMAVGNVIGSNISNICLILGITALVRPIRVHISMLRREYPILILVTALAWLLASNGQISRFDGILLTSGLAFFLLWAVKIAQYETKAYVLPVDEGSLQIPALSFRTSVIQLFVGLLLLLLGSRLLIWGGVGFAHLFGVDELIIGLTLVAVGTSLPELATTLAGSMKKQDDIAVGNVIGSNIFNTLGILGVPAIIGPLPVAVGALHRDLPVMALATLALWPICKAWHGRKGRINRWEGLALLSGYLIYISVLFF